MKRQASVCSLVALAFVSLVESSSSDSVNLTAGAWQIFSQVGKDLEQETDFQSGPAPVALPFILDQAVSIGALSSSLHYEMTSMGMVTTFDHALDSDTDPDSPFLGEARTAGIYEVSVLNDSPYSLSGTYTLNGVDRMVWIVELRDQTTGNVLFNYLVDSFNVPNQILALGQPPVVGTFFVSQSGSLTGTLLAGHRYRLDYDGFIEPVFLGEENNSLPLGTAHGVLNFNIVPLPSSLALALAAALPVSAFSLMHRRHARLAPAPR